MAGSNKETHAPTFIRYGGGLDQFGNATKSQGLVIDPGLLRRDALPSGEASEPPTSVLDEHSKEVLTEGAFLLVRNTGITSDSPDSQEIKPLARGLEELLPLPGQVVPLPSRRPDSESPRISLPRLASCASSSPRPGTVSVHRKGYAAEGSHKTRAGMTDQRQSSSPRLIRSTPEAAAGNTVYDQRPSRGFTLSPGRHTTCSPVPALPSEASVVGTTPRSSVTVCPSPSSTDTDALSHQNLESAQCLVPEQSLALTLAKVVERLLARCDLEPGIPHPVSPLQVGDALTDQEISGVSITSPLVAGNPPIGGAMRQMKRSWSEYGGDRTTKGSDLRSPKLRKAVQKGPRYFSCPFSKLHPIRHADCCKLTLTRIRDVKQHLTWRHSPQFYCERCYAIFQAEATHEDHVINASCVRLPSAELDGISHATDRALRRKLDHDLTEEEQWLAIWRILFPWSEKPASVFVPTDLSAKLEVFRKHWREQGKQLLVELVGVLESEQTEQENLLQILDMGTGVLINQWLLELTGAPELKALKGDDMKSEGLGALL